MIKINSFLPATAKLKFYISIIAVLSLFSILYAPVASSCELLQAEMQEYNADNYTISYPKSWQLQSSGNMQGFLSPAESPDDTFQENINVLIQDLSKQPMTLDEYTTLSKKQITAAMGADALLSLKRISLSGKQADEAVYSMTYQGKSLKVKGVWLIENNKAYVITYTAEPGKFDKYLGEAGQAISSFKLKAGK